MTDDLKQAVSEALEPCPFCGGPASLEQVEGVTGTILFSVGCDSDDEADCMGFQNLTVFNRRSEAIAAWNRRSASTTAPAGESVMVKALPRVPHDEESYGWTLTEEVRLALQKAAEEWQHVTLEAVETIALEVERRVLACLTTPIPAEIERGPAEAGEAVAGPVSEVMAWQCRSRPWAGSGNGTAKWSDWMPGHSDGYAKTEPGDWENRPLYARPVEEPGEVERLTHQNNRLIDATIDAEAALTAALESKARLVEAAQSFMSLFVADGEPPMLSAEDIDHQQLASRFDALRESLASEPDAQGRAEGSDALAEMRERLEKMEAAARRAMAIYQDDESDDVPADMFMALTAALSTQESSAALAGDGKEAGR